MPITPSPRRIEKKPKRLCLFNNQTVNTSAATPTKSVRWVADIAEKRPHVLHSPKNQTVSSPSIVRNRQAGPISVNQLQLDDEQVETLSYREGIVLASGEKWHISKKAHRLLVPTYRCLRAIRRLQMEEYNFGIAPLYDMIDVITMNVSSEEADRYMADFPLPPVLNGNQATTATTTRCGRQVQPPDRLTFHHFGKAVGL